MSKFEEGYKKFEEFVSKYNIITKDDNKITIAYSGGKDASLMCDFLGEYKKRNKKDLKLQLLVAKFPKFLFNTDNPDRLKQIKDAFSYWEEKGFFITGLDYEICNEKEFLDADNPCKICAKIKTELMGKYIRKDADSETVYALGMNFDDCLSWLLEIVLLSTKYGNINELKEKEPDLYRYILTLSIRITHRLYDEKSNTRFIRPIIAFTNKEITEIVTEREIPLIPEDCKEISHKDTFLDSPRREFSMAIEAMRDKYDMEGKDECAVYNNYESTLEFVTNSSIFPSIEELDDYMVNSLMV